MRSLLINISKRYPIMRSLRHYYVLVRNFLLWIMYTMRPIKRHTIIFQAYSGSYTCTPKALYQQLLRDERFLDYDFIWVVSDKEKYEFLAANQRTSLVTIRSKEYYQAFARSRYWIVNVMLPLRIVKTKGQVMVQCWHGTPLKRLRNDIIEDTQNAMNSRQDFIRKNLIDARRYDFFISPSHFASEKFASAFGMNDKNDREKIIEVGYPRNDALHTTSSSEIVRIKNQLGVPLDKKVLLYAPTWRDDQHDSKIGYTHQNELDFDTFKEQLSDEYVVLFRAHYMIANSFDFKNYEDFVFDVSEVDDINDLYLVSDALITDYSSVMFDYANLEKPMLFYMYDREHYENNLRGFYVDLRELPGDIITTQEQLTRTIRTLDKYQKKHKKAYLKFMQKYTYLDDGKASSRLINSIFDLPLPHPIYQLRRYRPLVQQGVNNG